MPEIHVLDVEANRWNRGSEDEYLWWPRVLWIDPGGVSGVATVWFDPQALLGGATVARSILAYSELFLHGPEAGLNGQVNRYLKLRRNLAGEPGLATGCESFVVRRFDQSEDFLAPVRIRAALDYALSKTTPDDNREGTGEWKPVRDSKSGKFVRDEEGKVARQLLLPPGVPLHVQSPSDALPTFNNDRLKNLRMYTPGPDHINDAKRHCLLWMRRVQASGMDFFKKAHGYEAGWFE